jgi:hypothetical protein
MEFSASYRWGSCRRCAFAAEPKSQMRGRPSRVTSAQRSPLLKAQYPICVAVAYRMFDVSNKRTAPRSNSSSIVRTRPRRY